MRGGLLGDAIAQPFLTSRLGGFGCRSTSTRVRGADDHVTDTASFVVQIHFDRPDDESFRGQVEHLETGDELRFTTFAGLLEFLRRAGSGRRCSRDRG
jgi:hypothetical protein